MNNIDIEKMEDLSSGLHGLAGALATMSCALSDLSADIPNPDYMRAAIIWMMDNVEQYERELDGIILRSRKNASA